jgi:hypothetical protein
VQTEDLISKLSEDVRSRPHNAAGLRFGFALAVGAAMSLALLILLVGIRPDIPSASATLPFWMKWMFTLGVMAAAYFVVRRLAQPAMAIGWLKMALAIPFVVVTAMGLGQLAILPPDQWESSIMGRTASICPVSIVGLAAPVFAALVWAFRRMAPTRLALAGAASGVLSAGVSASVYALSCPEQSPAFMMTWYTLGMIMAGAIGALAGRLLLRW